MGATLYIVLENFGCFSDMIFFLFQEHVRTAKDTRNYTSRKSQKLQRFPLSVATILSVFAHNQYKLMNYPSCLM